MLKLKDKFSALILNEDQACKVTIAHISNFAFCEKLSSISRANKITFSNKALKTQNVKSTVLCVVVLSCVGNNNKIQRVSFTQKNCCKLCIVLVNLKHGCSLCGDCSNFWETHATGAVLQWTPTKASTNAFNEKQSSPFTRAISFAYYVYASKQANFVKP